MQTRRQHSSTPRFEQSAFASSTGFDRGVLGNLVAARCQQLGDREAVAVLWWLQNVSWREGGLDKFAAEFLATHQHLVGTQAMHRFGIKPGQVYDANQVRAIRGELRGDYKRSSDRFLLKGERSLSAALAARARRLLDSAYEGEECRDIADLNERAERHPSSYPAAEFLELCAMEPPELAKHLGQMLVDPQTDPSAGLWNLPGLWPALRALRNHEARGAAGQIVETDITRQIAEELDFAMEARTFILVEGREGVGKSEAARAWCDRHPGQAVYVQLESGSDETTLYRAIARQIGTSCSYTRKAVEMRARIQDALQPGQLMLVLDEAHFLFPQSDRCERAVPKRIDWLRTALVDHGVPVALISTPQFFNKACDRFRKAGWNSLQVQRRLARTVQLPEELNVDDILAVTRKQFPAADAKTCKLIAAHALATVGYLTTITHLRKRVSFLAARRPNSSERELIAEELNATGLAPIAQPPADGLRLPQGSLNDALNRRRDAVEIPSRFTNAPPLSV